MSVKHNDAYRKQINQAPQPLARINQLATTDQFRTVRLRFQTTFILLLLFGAGCAALNGSSDADIASTWIKARVYLPQVPSYVKPADVSVAGKLPTVVYLHGCTGFSPGDARWARTLTSAGYGVVLPDSFARSYRLSNCDPKTHFAGAFLAAGGMRQEEIEHALKMLMAAPWADQENLFLMGHSEGGGAVARWPNGGFKAHIISGNRCKRGLPAPASIGVLVISFLHDPWDGNYHRTCAIWFGGRESTSELLLPGAGHDTSQSPQAQHAVLDFLQAHTSPHERN